MQLELAKQIQTQMSNQIAAVKSASLYKTSAGMNKFSTPVLKTSEFHSFLVVSCEDLLKHQEQCKQSAYCLS